MALGVLNNLSAIYAENNLNNTSNSLQKVLEQLSSGSKINSGADDSAGLSLVNGLEANSTALAQSETNATEGVGLLQVADGALSQVTNLLDRAITLATEASNGTLNTSQLAAANQEYTSIMSEVNNIGSTTTYNQQQVFAGRTVAIYTGDSSLTGSSIDDLNIRSLSSSSVGDTGGAMSYSSGQGNVFIDLSKGGTNASASDSLGTPGSASSSTTITVNYLAKGASGNATNATANITVGAGTNFADTAQGMINAINSSGLGLSASFGTAAEAGTAATAAAIASGTAGGTANDTDIIISGTGVGTGTSGAGEIGTLTVANSTDTLGGTLTVVGTDGKSHSITLGTPNSTDTIANLAATINSAGYGVTATANAAIVGGHNVGTVLTFSASSAAVTVAGTSVTDGGVSDSLTGLPTIDTPYSSTVGTISNMTAGTTFSAGTLKIGSNAAIALSGDTLATLASTINKGSYGVAATVNSAGTAISFTSSNSADTFSVTGATDTAADSIKSTTAVADPNQIGTLTLSGATGGATDVLTAGTTITIGGNTFTVAVGNQTMAQFAASITAANDGITATVAANGATSEIMTFESTSPSTQGIKISANTLTDTTLPAATFATVTDTPNSANSEYYSVSITGSILDTTTQGGTLTTGMVVDTNGTSGAATTSYTDGAGANLANTDLLSQPDAQAALTALATAITDVASMDGYIGAQINTLNSVSQVMTTQQENVTSAQNAIQATDYASATAAMSKYEILSQTGIAALAQANTVQQEVTKLLQ